MEFPNTPIDFPEFNRDHPAAQTPLGLPRPSEIQGPIFYDTETSGLHPDDGSRVSVVSLAYQVKGDPVPRSAAYPFGQGPDNELDLGRRAWNHLIRWMSTAGSGLVGHNIRFDIHQMAGRSIHGYPGRDFTDRVIFDTMVAAPEVWPRGPIALKKIATRLYGHDADEEQKALKPHLGPKSNPRFDRVPWEVMYPYAIRDAELTWAVYFEQRAWLDESTLTGRFIPQEMDIVRCLLRMEQAGLPYNPTQSLEYAQRLHESMNRIQSQVPYEIRPKMLRQYYFGEGEHDLGRGSSVQCLGLPPYSTTATGQPQLTAAVVRSMVDDEVPFARDLQEYNRLKSAISKWYEPFAQRAGEDGRIRTSFRHTGGTKSGRFSATRINLQAVPKDYALHLPVPTPRQVVADTVRAFPAPPGSDHWELWDLDLEQAELRLAALDAGCETMLDHIREGRDPHGETAQDLFGLKPGDDDWDMFRSIAKRANFSLIFGSGPQTFQEMLANQAGVKMSLRQVRRIVYDWRDLYPEFGRAIEEHMAFAERHAFVEMTTGRPRYYAPGEDRHSAFNQRIQGSLAEYGKRWLISTDRLVRPYREVGRRLGIGYSGLLLVVHDSQVMLLPSSDAAHVVDQVCENARVIWADMFPGVPGGADSDRWA